MGKPLEGQQLSNFVTVSHWTIWDLNRLVKHFSRASERNEEYQQSVVGSEIFSPLIFSVCSEILTVSLMRIVSDRIWSCKQAYYNIHLILFSV